MPRFWTQQLATLLAEDDCDSNRLPDLRSSYDFCGPKVVEEFKLYLGFTPKHLLHGKIAVELIQDSETNMFLKRSIQNKSAFRHSLVPVLRCCLSLTSANALLGRGKLFLLSHTNIKCFFEGIDTRGCILDVGAGDGCVSQYLKTLFSEVVAVESSLFMVLRLRAAGFKSVHSSSLSAFDSASFDAVSLLNIVDRVDDPFALLEDAARIVKDKGLVLIALVFPYDPLVELGPRFAKPSRRLPLSAESPEQFVAEFSCKVCSGLGLSLIRCGRVPYLSEGGGGSPFFQLDCSIMLFRKGLN
eukprot:CAMPEP_0113889888 /NCGR_PEP_ID=MMETSP0780_2-20120614/13794_1 /TAXON_ID=652834 /ORGANISM="Palpitomonas bilix" /LENGTH=299 /DNA_ID=CAMNT_0000879131 /DNA_START=347 /DNA_END=1246 /DNA_ORIENTATION=- /assembly_acc=CAM_ASM_000599